jgi:hypothetical protein
MTGRAGARRDRGAALLLVVVALALLGALALGAFGEARREARSAADFMYAAEAFEAAEAGLARAAAPWDTTALGAPVWIPQPGPSVVSSRTRSSTTVTRLNGTLFLIVGTGERLDGEGGLLARRSLSMVAKSQLPSAGGPAVLVPIRERSWAQRYN